MLSDHRFDARTFGRQLDPALDGHRIRVRHPGRRVEALERPGVGKGDDLLQEIGAALALVGQCFLEGFRPCARRNPEKVEHGAVIAARRETGTPSGVDFWAMSKSPSDADLEFETRGGLGCFWVPIVLIICVTIVEIVQIVWGKP